MGALIGVALACLPASETRFESDGGASDPGAGAACCYASGDAGDAEDAAEQTLGDGGDDAGEGALNDPTDAGDRATGGGHSKKDAGPSFAECVSGPLCMTLPDVSCPIDRPYCCYIGDMTFACTSPNCVNVVGTCFEDIDVGP
jgi:hypothetical protein